MLAYAANRPVVGQRPSSPSAMLLIISAHIALIAAVMSAKMEIQQRKPHEPPIIFVPKPVDPPLGPRTKRNPQTPTTDPQPTAPDPRVPTPPAGGDTAIDTGPIALGGGGASNIPQFPIGLPVPVRHEARLLTRPDELKPPYPEAKILSEEEATLKLRLTISDSGRVTAVDPIGAADRVFLEAARRYLIAHWRYQPATEDGRAIASSVTISVHFQLDG